MSFFVNWKYSIRLVRNQWPKARYGSWASSRLAVFPDPTCFWSTLIKQIKLPCSSQSHFLLIHCKKKEAKGEVGDS